MDTNTAITETAAFEGYRANPYKDSLNLWTIGEGRCLETNPLTGAEWKALLDSGDITVNMSPRGARTLLTARINQVDSDLALHLYFYRAAPSVVQTVLVEMAYQLGVASLLSFHDFLGFVQAGKYADAAADGRGTKWYRETPKRAEVLMHRLEQV